MEDGTHGPVHFSFGGTGGVHLRETNAYLKEKYGFTDSELFILGHSSQSFFKAALTPLLNSPKIANSKPYDVKGKLHYPLQCSLNPWQSDSLTTTKAPGVKGGPTCVYNPLLKSDEYLRTVKIPKTQYEAAADFLDLMFASVPGTPQTEFHERLLALPLESIQDILSHYASKFQFDGDMAGSSAATEPLFWIAHGAVERLFQRVMFFNLTSDKIYADATESCSGHKALGTKFWLKGFEFDLVDVKAEELTNVDLTTILDPTSPEYAQYINFVYDHSDWHNMCQKVSFFQL